MGSTSQQSGYRIAAIQKVATLPSYRAAKEEGLVIRPNGKVHSWQLRYDPQGAGAEGRIYFRLDDVEQSFDLKPGTRQAGAVFDRFGIRNHQRGGSYVNFYLDDLRFTADRPQHNDNLRNTK